VRALTANRISVFRLTRNSSAKNSQEIAWDPQAPQPLSAPSQLEGFDAAIHLSGANVGARRWTPAYKREIVESRVRTTQALTRLLSGLKHPPSVLLCASATGIYGDRGGEILTESSGAGSGFLAETCLAWEAAAQPARDAGIRVAHLRFGVVLSPEGGALARMLPLFRMGLGGRLGSGEQWMSWISLPDMTGAVLHIINESQLSGPVNLVAPIPVTNAEFTRALARAVHRPAIFPAPAFALRLAFGEMAREALLASMRAIPSRLAESGFRFQHAQLGLALESLLG
jgi:uncharacterized protein (TIGR01777 family)